MSWLTKWWHGGWPEDLAAALLIGNITPQEALQAAAAGTLAIGLSKESRKEQAVRYLTIAEAVLTSLGRQDLALKASEICKALNIGT